MPNVTRSSAVRLRPVIVTITLLLVGLLAERTKTRAADFSQEESFWVATATDAHPRNPTPISLLASVVRNDGDLDRACRLFEVAHRVGLSPLNPTIGLHTQRRLAENLAGCWALVGRFEEAVRLLEGVTGQNPSARAVMALGFAKLHILEFDAAEVTFKRALSLDGRLRPIINDALANLSEARIEAGRFPRPDQDIAFVAPEYRLAYARYLARVGRLPDAERAFLAIAEDMNAPNDEHRAALTFIGTYGSLDSMERGNRTSRPVTPNVLSQDFDERLMGRRAAYTRLAPLLPSIDALITE